MPTNCRIVDFNKQIYLTVYSKWRYAFSIESYLFKLTGEGKFVFVAMQISNRLGNKKDRCECFRENPHLKMDTLLNNVHLISMKSVLDLLFRKGKS